MLFPVVDLSTWCRQYDLKIVKSRCTTCKRPLRTTVPFADTDWRGLLSPACECGREIGQLSTQASISGKHMAFARALGLEG